MTRSSKEVSSPLLCFTHVQKAGGTTVEAVMRRNLGIRHMIVEPRYGWVYRESDLRADLRLNPFARNIGSHWLRPFVDFGEFEDRLVWYTILRRPVDRYLSHFQHHAEQLGSTQPFERFLTKEIQQNWQTRLLAGEPDVEAAKQILASRYRCVALLERFDESLLLIRERLGLQGLKLAYGRPHNTNRSSSFRETLREQRERHRDAIEENNRLDLELYDFAVREIFPRQVREYGEERLRADLAAEFAEYAPDGWDRLRETSHIAFRRVIQHPVTRLRRAIARTRKVPFERR